MRESDFLDAGYFLYYVYLAFVRVEMFFLEKWRSHPTKFGAESF